MIKFALMFLIGNAAGMFNAYLAYRCVEIKEYVFAGVFAVLAWVLSIVPKNVHVEVGRNGESVREKEDENADS